MIINYNYILKLGGIRGVKELKTSLFPRVKISSLPVTDGH